MNAADLYTHHRQDAYTVDIRRSRRTRFLMRTEPNCIGLKTAVGRRVLIAFSSERISQARNKLFERVPEKRAPLNSVDDITEKKRTY